jgi:hypothetical protein
MSAQRFHFNRAFSPTELAKSFVQCSKGLINGQSRHHGQTASMQAAMKFIRLVILLGSGGARLALINQGRYEGARIKGGARLPSLCAAQWIL